MSTSIAASRARIFIAFITLCSTHVFAQKKPDYAGFYISKSGEMTAGVFPRYKQWSRNPDKVLFVEAGSKKELTLTPQNSRGFTVTDYDSYTAYTGQRMTNAITFNSAGIDNTGQFDTLDTFLRKIASTSQYDFYVYSDRQRINLFYSAADKEIKELVKKVILDNNRLVEFNTFHEQLLALFPEPTVTSEVKSLRYSEESLASFVNHQNGDKQTVRRTKAGDHGLILSLGISSNTLKLKVTNGLDYTHKNYPSSIAPIAAIGYMFTLDRSLANFYFLPELKVSSYKNSGVSYYNVGTTAFKSTFKSDAIISVGLHVGYNFINTNKVKFSLVPGANIAFLINNQQIEEASFITGFQSKQVIALSHISVYFSIRANVMLKNHFLIWAGNNFPMSVTNYDAKFARLLSIQGGIGYRF